MQNNDNNKALEAAARIKFDRNYSALYPEDREEKWQDEKLDWMMDAQNIIQTFLSNIDRVRLMTIIDNAEIIHRDDEIFIEDSYGLVVYLLQELLNQAGNEQEKL